jgi:uncharacterized protein YqgC (DUF456 family)
VDNLEMDAVRQMDWIWYVVLMAVLLVGFLLTLINMPGNWIMVAATAGYATLTWPRHVGWWVLALITVLALIGEVVESLAGSAGAKRAGGTARGGWGAFIGGLLGGFFLTFLVPIPVVGTVVGICVGAFMGAMLMELSGGKSHEDALQIGIGAAHGRFMGILTKIGFGIAIFLISTYAAFPVHRT